MKDWRPKKTNEPDPGTYEAFESYKRVAKRPGTATISNAKIKSFNELAASNKRNVPGSGHYDYMKAYDHISRPMKRGRR